MKRELPTCVMKPKIVFKANVLKMIFRSAATKLLHASWDIPMLHLEDVFWTGIVSEKAGVTPLGNNGLFHFYQVQPVNRCIYLRIISSHLMSQDEYQYNRYIKEDVPGRKNCSARKIGVTCTYREDMKSTDFRKNFLCE